MAPVADGLVDRRRRSDRLDWPCALPGIRQARGKVTLRKSGDKDRYWDTGSCAGSGHCALTWQLAGGEISGGGTHGPVSVATMTTLSSSASDPSNPPPFGQPITFTATISLPSAMYGTPTGSVEFYDETTGSNLGTVTQLTDNLDGTYSAALSVANLDVEDHYVTATYSGDSTFATSTSDRYDQQVAPGIDLRGGPDAPPMLTARSSWTRPSAWSAARARRPAASSFTTARPTSAPARQAAAGQWSLTTSAVPPGSHTIIAVYSGDDHFAGSQSSGGPVTIVGQALSVSMGLRDVPGRGPATNTKATWRRCLSAFNLYGAAFTVTVVWGDGNPAEAFAFAGGSNSASEKH